MVREDGAGSVEAFFKQVQRNRGAPAAAVATARKLAVMIWHVLMEGDRIRLRAARLAREA
jgi:transposase